MQSQTMYRVWICHSHFEIWKVSLSLCETKYLKNEENALLNIYYLFTFFICTTFLLQKYKNKDVIISCKTTALAYTLTIVLKQNYK